MVYNHVNKGNTILVPAESLGGEERKKITVSWTGKNGLLYVQSDKLEEFKSKKTGGEDFTFTVDETFQYGSNDDVTIFFLVFHNQDNKPFQVSQLEGQAADFIAGLGLKSQAESFIGEYLEDYED
ncbi:hypothetical protein J4E86_008884 [Alternaria arbusti]|uniref:uncharacterized protein n=1 Tax=Alternaria arbusti TaxID=232088 RepID=UPI00222066ED|nr:uncharacterized protein J4E86_008884 [Alternaria arbusti]KAI4946181.1 hypothetical protein J4E86_008884 [Alternaria arbusti]